MTVEKKKAESRNCQGLEGNQDDHFAEEQSLGQKLFSTLSANPPCFLLQDREAWTGKNLSARARSSFPVMFHFRPARSV